MKKKNILRPKRQMILFNLMINFPLLGFFCVSYVRLLSHSGAKAIIIVDDESVTARRDNGRVRDWQGMNQT